MDRRAAGALLALAACIASSAAAPTASNHTALDLYEGAPEGCYYNFQHYGEGDRIMTNEPCLNCTCHNRMLMCYLRVCPFTKPIGQDCTVEKRADQCCPIITCPDVPVDLLTSTSTSSPAEYGATGLGKVDKYGCSINGKYFPEGSKVPPTPNKPCEHCYCIRNMTTCVMQECTLHVDGCTPIYHKEVCCPIRYSCDHEDEVPLLDDMSTTVRPTPGFILTTTTISPVTQMTQDCIHNDRIISDGASITTEKACEHCYCMKGDIVCVVQECGAPMENEGKNCTSLPPREGQCCPDTYICEGDELSTEIYNEITTESILENLTTLSPPRRGGVEGSGYRIEPNEVIYTETSSTESNIEGSGDEEELTKPIEDHEDITPNVDDSDQYIPVTTKTPIKNESETSTTEIDKSPIVDSLDKETIRPDVYQTSIIPEQSTGDLNTLAILPQDYVTTEGTSIPENKDQFTTELIESLNTVPHILVEKEHNNLNEHTTILAESPNAGKTESSATQESEVTKVAPSIKDVTVNPALDLTSEPEYLTPIPETIDITTEKEDVTPEHVTRVDKPDDIIIKDVTIKPPSDLTSEPEYLTPIPETIDITTEKEDVTPEHVTRVDKPDDIIIKDVTINPPSDLTSEPEYLTPIPETQDIITEKADVTPEHVTRVDKPDDIIDSTTNIPVSEEVQSLTPEEISKDKAKPEQFVPTTTHTPLAVTTEINHEQNTVVVGEEDSHYVHITTSEAPLTTALISEELITDKPASEPEEKVSTEDAIVKEKETTAEPDKGLNTIPSEIDEHPSSVLSSIDVTTTSTEMRVTEKSPITSETSTLELESHTTKVDLYTITTEPSFRKEDEASISTEKTKEEFGPTTIKAEFVDEGLIPTSSHDNKLSTSSNVPLTEDDITTIVPEYIKELEDEAVTTKQPATESLPETSIALENLPGQITEKSDNVESTSSSSTEKYLDDITLVPDTNDEPSRIPGEGDCLLNGVTYRNNSIVPSTNNCHTGCKCVSSIVKCDPIICSPPPDYMSNCQSIYDTPDSCCPTYICDHPRETIPPQSDNQMSGTEPPIISPTIECQGDQCDLNVATQPTRPTELCPSGSCSAPGHESETNKCGSEGCSDVKESVSDKPSIEQTQCVDGKCEPPLEDCSDGKCPLSPTDTTTSNSPCKSDACKPIEDKLPNSQHCENEQECKKVDVPVTQTVTDNNCGSNGCEPSVILSPHDSQAELCKDKEKCQPGEIQPADCTGDKPCRRKDSSVTEKLPHNCEGNDCTQETVQPIDQSIDEINKTRPISDETPSTEVTQKMTPPIEEEQTAIGTETPSLDQEIKVTTHKNIITETIDMTHKDSDRESTKSPNIIEDYTATPVSSDDMVTTKLEDNQNVDEELKPTDNEGTQIPEFDDKQHVDKKEKDTNTSVEEEVTNIPYVTDETTDTAISGSDVTKDKIDEDSVTKVPDVTKGNDDILVKLPVQVIDHNEPTNTVQDHTVESNPITEEVTKTPDQITANTVIPHGVYEQETTSPAIVDNELDHKLSTVEDKGTNMPEVTEQYSENVTTISEITKQQGDDATKVEEFSTRVPAIKETYTESPISTHEPDIKVLDNKEPADISSAVGEEAIKVPVVTDKYSEKSTEIPKITIGYTHRVPPTDDLSTVPPSFIDTQSNVPVSVTELSPENGESYSDKPTSTKQPELNIPDITVKEPEDNLDQTQGEVTKSPEITEVITNEPTKIPEVVTEHTDQQIEVQNTIIPDTKEGITVTPVFSAEDGTKTPDFFDDNEIKPPQKYDSDKEKPITPVEELPKISPVTTDVIETESTTETINESATIKVITENLEASKDRSTIKPLTTDETTDIEVESGTNDLPIIPEDNSSDKEIDTDGQEEASQKPTVVIEDYTHTSIKPEQPDKSETSYGNTITPESASKTPEMYFTESDKDVTISANPTKESTETPDEETKKVTQGLPSTETGIPSKSSEITESEPSSYDSSTDFVNEVTTVVVTKQDQTTEVPVAITISENTLPPLREGGEQKQTESPGTTVNSESAVEKITKPTELEISGVSEEGYTGIPEQEPSVTKTPVEVIIEPEEWELPESPDSIHTSPPSEKIPTQESDTTPESHITNIVPEYEGTTASPVLDKETNTIDSDPHKSKLPEVNEVEVEYTPTKATVKDDEKGQQPDIYTPEKEEMITAGIDSTSSQTPLQSFTNVDSEEQATTEYKEAITESVEQFTTKKIDDSSEPLNFATSTKSQDGYTDTPVVEQTNPEEIYNEPTTSKSSNDIPLSGEPNRRTQIPTIDKTTPGASEYTATESPTSVTEFTAKPIGSTDNVAISEEQTTKVLDPASEMDAVPVTTIPETYNEPTKEPVVTKIPDSYKPASPEPEQPKTTEPSNIDTPVTDDKQTDSKFENPEPVDVEKITTVTQEPANPIGSESTESEKDLGVHKSSTESPSTVLEIHTDLPITQVTPEASLSLVTEYQPQHVTTDEQDHTEKVPKESEAGVQEPPTKGEDVDTTLLEATTAKPLDVTKNVDKTTSQVEFTETTPYLVELEEHTEKMIDDSNITASVSEKEPIYEKEEPATTQTPLKEKPASTQVITPPPTDEEHTVKVDEYSPTVSTSEVDDTEKHTGETTSVSPSISEIATEKEEDSEKLTEKTPENDVETATSKSDIPIGSSEETSTISGDMSYPSTLSVSIDTDAEKKPVSDQTTGTTTIAEEGEVSTKDSSTPKPSQDSEETTPLTFTSTEKSPISESHVKVPTIEESDQPSIEASSHKTTASEDEVLSSTTKATPVIQEEVSLPSSEEKYSPPEEKPTSEAFSTSSTTEGPKPSIDLESTEEVPAPEDDGLSPSGGYGEPDYPEEDQAFGPGTCRYGGKVYVSAQQIPRDDPCDFCFCFRSDIICLQQSCPPPIHGCHEEPIQGFCCPRYECPVSMATSVNVTTTTTTTTTTLPPHFPTHGYKGAAQRRGCQIKGHSYKVGEVVRSSSGPCLHCTCGGDGQMKCDPKACTPEPMLRQMIAAAVSAKRRR